MSFIQVLAAIGLVVGLVVFFIVVGLLQGTLSPLLRILEDVKSAKTAPMLERGVPGTEQLSQTRQLAASVPPLAIAYLNKLGAVARQPAYVPAPAAYSPAPAAPDAAPAAGGYAPAEQPAWKRYIR